MENIRNIIYNQLRPFGIPIDNKTVNIVNVGTNTDYSIKSLVPLQNLLKSQNIIVSIDDIIDELKNKLHPQMFQLVANNNTINITLNNNFVENNIINLLTSDNIIKQTDKPLKILVDFSSPNIAKDLHVGHLRSTIIGDSVCKLFELQGHKVLRVNHIGDYGLGIGMVIAYLLKEYPNYEELNLDLSNLQTFYSQAKKLFDQDNELRE